MKRTVIWLIATAFIAPAVLAATAVDDFYDSAFRRGVAAFEAGAYDVAYGRLRVAAFGFVDDPARFEIAQSYLAVAAQRRNRPDDAKLALKRLVAAERIERHFVSLQITAALREAIETAAKELLPPEQSAWLTNPPAAGQIAAPDPVPPPKTQTIVVPDPIKPEGKPPAS